MGNLTTQAIVLRYANFKEHDRMLTLFSPEHGRLDVAAYGCRRQKSPLLAACQPFTYGEFVLKERQGRYTLAQCDIQDAFFDLRTRLDAFAYASYLCQLCLEAVHPGEGNPELFALLLRAVALLSYSTVMPGDVALAFIMQYMDLLGFRPELSHCLGCGIQVPQGAAWFDAAQGGIVCPRCRREASLPFTQRARTLIRLLLDTGIERMETLKISPDARRELDQILNPFLTYRLERKFKSHALIERLEELNRSMQ